MRSYGITGILATNIFLSGVAFAATAPYRAIVGVEELGLSNAEFGVVMALNAIGGAAAAVTLGWLSDKAGDRRKLVLLCAIVGAAGFWVVWAFQTPVAFVAAFCLLIPFGNALFSQSFSYSRAYFDREAPGRAELVMSFLRSTFTVAWVIVPPFAGWIAAQSSALTVFIVAAVAHVGCTLLIALLWTQPAARIGFKSDTGADVKDAELPRAHIARSHKIGIVGVTLGLVALQLNMIALPLVILRDLDGSLTEVGFNAAFAAAVEVPFMIGWGYLALRMRKETILAISCAVFAVYLGMLSVANSFLQVLLLQVVAAIAIAALLSISISYLQEAIKGRVGLSTSLVDVTRVISALLASAVFAFNPAELYGPMMVVAAVSSLFGAALMIVARSASAEIPGGTPEEGEARSTTRW